MKMFSECSGECCICACGDFCIAGHGDDNFCLASVKQIIDKLDRGTYTSYVDYMIDFLKESGYEYDLKNLGSKKEEKEEKIEKNNFEVFGGYTYKMNKGG